MHFDPTGIGQGILESLAVGFIQAAMRATQHFGALLLSRHIEPKDVTGHFDLLAQGKALDASDDGFYHSHSAAKIKQLKGKGER